MFGCIYIININTHTDTHIFTANTYLIGNKSEIENYFSPSRTHFLSLFSCLFPQNIAIVVIVMIALFCGGWPVLRIENLYHFISHTNAISTCMGCQRETATATTTSVSMSNVNNNNINYFICVCVQSKHKQKVTCSCYRMVCSYFILVISIHFNLGAVVCAVCAHAHIV